MEMHEALSLQEVKPGQGSPNFVRSQPNKVSLAQALGLLSSAQVGM